MNGGQVRIAKAAATDTVECVLKYMPLGLWLAQTYFDHFLGGGFSLPQAGMAQERPPEVAALRTAKRHQVPPFSYAKPSL